MTHWTAHETPEERRARVVANRAIRNANRDAGAGVNAFPCPACAGRTTVIDSRPAPDGGIRRRRRCLSCDAPFTTYERTREALTSTDPRVAAFKTKLRELQALFDALPYQPDWDEL